MINFPNVQISSPGVFRILLWTALFALAGMTAAAIFFTTFR